MMLIAVSTSAWAVGAVDEVVAVGDAIENVSVRPFISVIVFAHCLLTLYVEATVVAATAIFVAAGAAAAAGYDAAGFETRSFGAVRLTNDLFLVH